MLGIISRKSNQAMIADSWDLCRRSSEAVAQSQETVARTLQAIARITALIERVK